MKHILLPTDFSDNSWNAITYAIRFFKDSSCTFYILNTYTPVIYHVEYVLGYPAQFGLGDAIRNTSERGLDELIAKIDKDFGKNPKHKFKTIARFNTLVSGIKEFISEQSVDLIVLGTKGATGAKEILFGSNTVNVFNEIKCPVLAIPSGFAYEVPLEILFPTDLQINYMDTSLHLLRDIATLHHSRINALHVSTGYELTEVQQNNELELEHMFEELSFLYHEYEIMNVTDAIAKFQTKLNFNLLVMINNKRSFFENIFFKSTLNQIGFHLNVPILVIPSHKNKSS